jgi:hypothetical protein
MEKANSRRNRRAFATIIIIIITPERNQIHVPLNINIESTFLLALSLLQNSNIVNTIRIWEAVQTTKIKSHHHLQKFASHTQKQQQVEVGK